MKAARVIGVGAAAGLIFGLALGWYLRASGAADFVHECNQIGRQALIVNGTWQCLPPLL